MKSKVVERLPGRGVAGALRALGLVFALALSCLPAFSQTNFGRITGSITDQTGGAMANAKVTVTDVERGTSRVIDVDASGQYSAPNLTPGTYTIKAEAAGFKTLERQNIQVLTGQEVGVDLTLQPGEQNQTVTVTEELPLVNTTSAVVNSTIENKDLAELPVNGRNYVGMSDLRPGIQTNPGGGTDARRSNGQNSENNIWLMDGLNTRGIYGGNPVLGAGNLAGEGATLVPLDTIQEVSFAENPKAEYGFGTGAVINLGFKSGTNLLHGTAYAFGRWSGINAQNPFAALPVNVSLEQFGNSLGGAIKKDKIFFFGGYEGKRTESSATTQATEPTTVAGLGTTNSFPDAIAALEGAGFCNGAAAGCTGAKVISPLSLNLAGCTIAGLNGAATCDATKGLFNNGTANANAKVPIQIPNFQHTDNFLVKLDDRISDNNSVHGEYFLGTGDTYSTCGSNPIQPWWGCATPVRGQGVAIVDVWTPNSNWVNELRGGWHRFNQIIGISECANYGALSAANPTVTGKSGLVAGSPDYTAQFGLVTGSAQPCAFPALTVSGFTALGNQARGYEPRLNQAWKGNDGLSWTHGKHLTKFGMEYRLDYVAGGARGNSQGVISFGGSGGNAPSITGLGTPTAIEDFLVGFQNTDQILTGDPSANTINHFYAGYVQDDWRVTNRFTANLGLRYEFSPPMSEAHNQFGVFIPGLSPSISPTGIVQLGVTPGVDNRIYNPKYTNFAPRLGFAWDLFGKGSTVVRAGTGWMYQTIALSGILGNGNVGPNNTPTGVPFYGVNGQPIASPVGGTQTAATVSFPAGTLPWAVNTPIFSSGSLACGPGAVPGAVIPAGLKAVPNQCNVGGFDPNLRQPIMYYWNADVQHAFPGAMSIDVAYVGNHTTGIFAQTNINQPLPGYANGSPFVAVGSSVAEQIRQPFFSTYPWVGAIRWFSNPNISNYHSMQITVTKRASHGLNFTGSYVLATAKDEVPGILGSSNYTDNYNPKADYGPTNTDPRHRFTLTATYAPPDHKAPLQMLSGWRINTVVYMITRIPYNAQDTTDDTSGTGVKLDKWSLVGNPHDFQFQQGLPGAGGFPCFGFAGSTFGKTANCQATLPQACIDAANAQPSNTGLPSTAGAPVAGAPSTPGNTALYNLYKYGCYMNNGSVIVPPAQGTQGNMTRNMLRGINQRQWDASITKEWKITERISTQYRLEVYNVINAVHYSSPSSNLGTPSTFGQSQSTLNLGGIAIAAGAPRQMQMGLKIIF